MKNSCNNNKKKIKWIPIFIVVTVHLKRNMYKQKVCELNLCLLWQNCVSYVYQSCLSCHLGSSVLNIIPGEYFRLIVWVVYILWVVHNLVGQYKKVCQKMKNIWQRTCYFVWMQKQRKIIHLSGKNWVKYISI